VIDSFKKLDPRVQVKNPVMFIVEVGSLITTVIWVRELLGGTGHPLFTGQVAFWLWFTVVFANFAEAMAEGRGKAQAAALRKTRAETTALRIRDGSQETVPASALRVGDVVRVEASQIIPGDGEVIEGIASVDESAITGESAPVIRESGGDRSAVTGGTRVLSDWILVRITSNPGQTFLDRMIALVEGAVRQKTPNEIALNILLAVLTLVFLLVVVTLEPFAVYAGTSVPVPVLISLLVCLIPTTIGALISAIGIAGMDRLVQHNVLAMSGRAVEAAGDVDTLLLDKTGTITLGNRHAVAFLPAPGVTQQVLADAAQLSSLADETPEGRSIVVLAKQFGIRARELAAHQAQLVPFSAQTRMSGITLDGRDIRKGAVDAIERWVRERGGTVPPELIAQADQVSKTGGTPLAVAENGRPLGVVHLKDIVKGGIRDRFAQLRQMGIKTVMITGDNPVTAAAIAAEAGVDDFMAQATPEDKLKLIRREQGDGRMVAMTGDGTNDAPALAQADVGVAMNTGTSAAKEAGNMVDLDSNPTKLLEVVEIGKQLLMTRGALTTFSIANDVAKYFAIIPAMFILALPQLAPLNVMRLATPESAILSAVIFNAVIIIALIPLALRGIAYRPIGSAALLRRNLLVYGVGGVILPFVGIKAIDVVLAAVGLAR
jgi:K+-transporting ATPase ATPase B chain